MTTNPVMSITDEQIAEIVRMNSELNELRCVVRYIRVDEVEALISRLRAAEKDAERYRWLIENSVCALKRNTHPVLVCSSNLPVIGWREEITRRIDAAAIRAAMQEQKP